MGTVILTIVVLSVMVLAVKFLYPQQKPGKQCQSCPAFKQCGGSKPRCPRRSGSV